MKKLFILSVLMSLTLCLSAQEKAVFLHIRHHLAGANFALNTAFSLSDNPDAKVTRLQYYVSGISLTHDAGTNTDVTDKYLLVNPAADSVYALGMFDITDLTQVNFKLGLDSAINHGDPALWPDGHPLALQDPSMHWGWAGGYRFLAFEGDAQVTSGGFGDHFEIHVIDDKNLKTVSLPVQGLVQGNELHIYINADYAQILTGIGLVGGLIEHGGGPIPSMAMSNMKNLVFSTNITSVKDAALRYDVRLFPNPSVGSITFLFDFADQKEVTLDLFDAQGRRVHQKTLATTQGSITIEDTLPAGTYSYTFSTPRATLKAGQFVVIE